MCRDLTEEEMQDAEIAEIARLGNEAIEDMDYDRIDELNEDLKEALGYDWDK